MREEWDRTFELIVPVVSAGISVLSVTVGIIALMRSSQGTAFQRVQQLDGRYMVYVRYPGEWHDIRDFITPDDPVVQKVVSEVGQDVWRLYDFVCQNFSYRRDIGEYWFFPFEALEKKIGDCDDSANTLTSLLRTFTSAYTVLGEYQGYGHAWTQTDSQILESTYTQARQVPDPQNYEAMVLFNDAEVIELYPGAVDYMFGMRRQEALKLNSLTKALEAV